MGEEFNVSLFEKKLQGLKDSQESINSLSAWCLENRQHHKKIVQAWLNVLKRVKVEHRLTLFYLANDVIQYSKRKNYEFVESWGTTLQKATTMVREEKVKHRVLRIFKIWEQRGIYGEEFLSDLSGLISVAPAKKSETEPLEFQPSYLISKINACSRLEEDTDLKLKRMKENEHKLLCDDPDAVVASLKDRQRVEDVEKEVEDGIKLVDAVMGALKAEISARKHLLNLLTQADNFYRTQRGEVKVVSNAYKNFGLRVKNLKKRLDEMLQDENRWSSPIPSPDVNAPSPSPDSDIELPGHGDELGDTIGYSLDQSYTAANFYTPIGSDQSNSFTNNGFTSFMGSNISFDIHANLFNDSSASHVSDTPVAPASNNLIEVVGSTPKSSLGNNQPPPSQQNSFSLNNIIKQLLPNTNSQMPSTDLVNPDPYQTTQQAPLLPPPMPPFTSPPTTYPTNNVAYSDPVYPPMADNSFGAVNRSYQQMPPSYIPPPEVQPPNVYGAPINDQRDYNPEEELETWENDGAWPEPPDMETPESPPGYEKEGVSEPVEYHDGPNHALMATQEDVDHRILLPPPHLPSHLADIKGPDTDHRVGRSANKDIDHRNLISLTGSPGPETSSTVPAPPIPPNLWNIDDQDYRMHGKDQDFRGPPPMMQHFVHLASEPPPPPPPMVLPVQTTNTPKVNKLKRGSSAMLRRSTTEDNVESIDMELSDDDQMAGHHIKRTPPKDRSMLAKHHGHHQQPHLGILESPPVPPTLDDDVDATANNIIETINQDDFLEGLTEINTSEPPPTPGTPGENTSFKERGWYNNEWTPPNGVQYNNEFTSPSGVPPPAGLLRPPGDYRRPLDFQGPPPPPPPPHFRGGGIIGGPPVFPRPPPPPLEHFQHFGSSGNGENSFQGHFRGGGMNRGGNRGGWGGNNNKMFNNRGNHHNRGGGNRGGYHQSPRGGGRGGNNSFRGGRGRGGGNYREQCSRKICCIRGCNKTSPQKHGFDMKGKFYKSFY